MKTKRDTTDNYNAVLFEDIRSKMDLVIEGLNANRIEFKQELKDFRGEVKGRFETLELAVTSNSQAIKGLKSEVGGLKTEVGGIKSEVGGLKSEMRQMEKRLSDKIDRNNAKLDNHEERITTLKTARL